MTTVNQLPPLRIFLVKRIDCTKCELQEILVRAHSMRAEESGALSFMTFMTMGVWDGGQIVGQITRLFSEWEDAEEVFEVDTTATDMN